MDNVLQQIYEGVITGNAGAVQASVQGALEKGIKPKEILDGGLVSAMAEVGRRFEEGEYFVPDMLISARAMQAGMTMLKPHLLEEKVSARGKVAIGTVKGDLHDIGKNLVGMMLEGAGFEVLDLGVDVAPEKFVAAAENVDVIALSALLTTTMGSMKITIDALKDAGKRSKVKVIIGGAPVTDAYAEEIEADGYAPDASRSVALAKALLNVN
jgi:5-methyltetrahydrofolate--homocysteine methyltransferase